MLHYINSSRLRRHFSSISTANETAHTHTMKWQNDKMTAISNVMQFQLISQIVSLIDSSQKQQWWQWDLGQIILYHELSLWQKQVAVRTCDTLYKTWYPDVRLTSVSVAPLLARNYIKLNTDNFSTNDCSFPVSYIFIFNDSSMHWMLSALNSWMSKKKKKSIEFFYSCLMVKISYILTCITTSVLLFALYCDFFKSKKVKWKRDASIHSFIHSVIRVLSVNT